MMKQFLEMLTEFFGLLVASGVLAGVIYVALVVCAGFSLTYGQIFGVFYTVKILRNWLK